MQLKTVSSDNLMCHLIWRIFFSLAKIRVSIFLPCCWKWINSHKVSAHYFSKLSHIYTQFAGCSELLTGFIQGHFVPLCGILCNNVFWGKIHSIKLMDFPCKYFLSLRNFNHFNHFNHWRSGKRALSISVITPFKKWSRFCLICALCHNFGTSEGLNSRLNAANLCSPLLEL